MINLTILPNHHPLACRHQSHEEKTDDTKQYVQFFHVAFILELWYEFSGVG